MAAPNVSREHRPFFRFRFPFSVVSGPSCQQFRTLFRTSFRLQPKIPYLIPEFIFLSFLGFAHSRIFRLFRVFRLFQFSRVQIRNSGFSVFSAFSACSGFQGSKSGIPVFPFFPLTGAPNPEFWGHVSGHVWCGHVWRAPKKNSRRLWRSRRRKSSSVPEGAANFPAAVSLPRKPKPRQG